MKKRTHSPTSKAAEEFIKPHKPTHYEKIIEALERLKVGGTYEEVSKVAGMKESQVWKRLSELQRDQKIFNTGITRKLSSGLKGAVWQLHGKRAVAISDNPKTDKEKQAYSIIKQLSLL